MPKIEDYQRIVIKRDSDAFIVDTLEGTRKFTLMDFKDYINSLIEAYNELHNIGSKDEEEKGDTDLNPTFDSVTLTGGRHEINGMQSPTILSGNSLPSASDYGYGTIFISTSVFSQHAPIYINDSGTWRNIQLGVAEFSNLRPQTSRLKAGYMFFDLTLNKPIWYTGSKWVDANGNEV